MARGGATSESDPRCGILDVPSVLSGGDVSMREAEPSWKFPQPIRLQTKTAAIKNEKSVLIVAHRRFLPNRQSPYCSRQSILTEAAHRHYSGIRFHIL